LLTSICLRASDVVDRPVRPLVAHALLDRGPRVRWPPVRLVSVRKAADERSWDTGGAAGGLRGAAVPAVCPPRRSETYVRRVARAPLSSLRALLTRPVGRASMRLAPQKHAVERDLKNEPEVGAAREEVGEW
jgi:hypothetical protein